MRYCIILATSLLCSYQNAWAGWHIVQQEQNQGVAQTTNMWFDSHRMRVDTGNNGQRALIELQKDQLTIIDTKNRTYTSMKLSDLSKRIKGMLDAASALIEQLPPEMRQGVPDVKKMFSFTVKPTGKQKDISGYKSKEFTVSQKDNTKVGAVWLSKDKILSKVHKDFMRFASAFDMSWNPSLGAIFKIAKNNGFPVKTSMNFMGHTRLTQVKSIKSIKIASSLFKVSEGFSKQDATNLFGQQPMLPTMPR